jgi:hypothetical protein
MVAQDFTNGTLVEIHGAHGSPLSFMISQPRLFVFRMQETTVELLGNPQRFLKDTSPRPYLAKANEPGRPAMRVDRQYRLPRPGGCRNVHEHQSAFGNLDRRSASASRLGEHSADFD